MENKNNCEWWEDSNGGWNTSCGGNRFIQDVSFNNDPEEDIGTCSSCNKKIKVVDREELD